MAWLALISRLVSTRMTWSGSSMASASAGLLVCTTTPAGRLAAAIAAVSMPGSKVALGSAGGCAPAPAGR